jgi:hypothetical protein
MKTVAKSRLVQLLLFVSQALPTDEQRTRRPNRHDAPDPHLFPRHTSSGGISGRPEVNDLRCAMSTVPRAGIKPPAAVRRSEHDIRNCELEPFSPGLYVYSPTQSGTHC